MQKQVNYKVAAQRLAPNAVEFVERETKYVWYAQIRNNGHIVASCYIPGWHQKKDVRKAMNKAWRIAFGRFLTEGKKYNPIQKKVIG